MFAETDKFFLKRAIELAKTREGFTAPNPPVGAVVVKNGKIIGEGCHAAAGTAHAEVVAITSCSESPQGGTIYVSLEPCSTFGRTPPCTDLIVKSGIGRVVIGCVDPNPKHAGNGLEILGKSGINVDVATADLNLECENLIRPFACKITKNRPFVTLKLGLTLDGKIADSRFSSKWITCDESRERVQLLRLKVDAIMVGGNTFRKDSPSLQPHIPNAPKKYRIIVSEKMQSPDDFTIVIPGKNLRRELSDVAMQFGINHILCEGGGSLASSLLDAGLVDEAFLFYAPIILNGTDAIPGFSCENERFLENAFKGDFKSVEKIGSDILLHWIPKIEEKR